jgi:hypothetical protein
MSAFQQWAISPPVPVPDNPGPHSDTVHRLDVIIDRAKALRAAQIASERCAEQRGKLDAGTSRARVTTANARWASAAEHRDRCERNLVAALESAGYARP